MDKKKIIYIVIGVIVILLIAAGAFIAGKQQSGTDTAAETTPTPTIETTVIPTLDISAPSVTPTKSVTSTPTKKPTATPSVTPTPSPTPTPGVVNIEASVSPTTSSSCTQKFTFTAKIYTNGAATVKYKWLRNDNATSAEQTLTYTGAGVQTVTTEWNIGPLASGASYSGWERIEITSPGSALGNKAEFTLSCP